MGKWNHSKVNETQEFLTLGHSNWTNCFLLDCFVPQISPPFYPDPHNKPFLYTAEAGKKEGEGPENGKREFEEESHDSDSEFVTDVTDSTLIPANFF